MNPKRIIIRRRRRRLQLLSTYPLIRLSIFRALLLQGPYELIITRETIASISFAVGTFSGTANNVIGIGWICDGCGNGQCSCDFHAARSYYLLQNASAGSTTTIFILVYQDGCCCCCWQRVGMEGICCQWWRQCKDDQQSSLRGHYHHRRRHFRFPIPISHFTFHIISHLHLTEMMAVSSTWRSWCLSSLSLSIHPTNQPHHMSHDHEQRTEEARARSCRGDQHSNISSHKHYHCHQ